jgi:hypothetical protein
MSKRDQGGSRQKAWLQFSLLCGTVALACGQTSHSAGNCGSDSAQGSCAEGGSWTGAGGAPDTVPAAACADYCVEPSCLSHWDVAEFCSSNSGSVFVSKCGNYQRYRALGVDASNSYYYDATGKLIAVVLENAILNSQEMECTSDGMAFELPPCSAETRIDCSAAGASGMGAK